MNTFFKSINTFYQHTSEAFIDVIDSMYVEDSSSSMLPRDPYIKMIVQKKRILYLLVLCLIIYLIGQFVFST